MSQQQHHVAPPRPRVGTRVRSAGLQTIAGGAMVQTKIGYGLSRLLGAGIIALGARFLVAPRVLGSRCAGNAL